MRLLFALLLLLAATVPLDVSAAKPQQATLYKDPMCDCCESYAAYLQQHGFDVRVVDTHDLSLLKEEHRVPAELAACHTMLVGGYVVEGHVPIGALSRLLAERPPIRGIALPGMPLGSPGMAGPKTEPFVIYQITDGVPAVYATG